jgi:hypothetical protein
MKHSFTLLLLALAFVGQAQSVTPQKMGGTKFSIDCANMHFEIDSAFGARISSFKVGGDELLYTTDAGGMYGSTFWPSPQSVWGWPPLANLDNKAYKTAIKGNKIIFTGNTDSKSNLRFYKTMVANSADTSIVIDYCMKNEKASAQSWAPWEVSRVIGKGITVFAKGEGEVTGKMSSFTEEVNGYVWYDQDQHSSTSSDFKFFCDGKGWLAHVVDGDKVFIKKFADIETTKAAPTEAEIEVYTANRNVYTELENQGAYTSIASKDSVTWRVTWFARKLPASVEVSVGSSSLVAYIEGVMNRSSSPVGNSNVLLASAVKVYPNPASRYLIVEADLDSYSNSSLTVYDVNGRIVMAKALTENHQQIALNDLQGGSYIYEVKQGSMSVKRGMFTVVR